MINAIIEQDSCWIKIMSSKRSDIIDSKLVLVIFILAFWVNSIHVFLYKKKNSKHKTVWHWSRPSSHSFIHSAISKFRYYAFWIQGKVTHSSLSCSLICIFPFFYVTLSLMKLIFLDKRNFQLHKKSWNCLVYRVNLWLKNLTKSISFFFLLLFVPIVI